MSFTLLGILQSQAAGGAFGPYWIYSNSDVNGGSEVAVMNDTDPEINYVGMYFEGVITKTDLNGEIGWQVSTTPTRQSYLQARWEGASAPFNENLFASGSDSSGYDVVELNKTTGAVEWRNSVTSGDFSIGGKSYLHRNQFYLGATQIAGGELLGTWFEFNQSDGSLNRQRRLGTTGEQRILDITVLKRTLTEGAFCGCVEISSEVRPYVGFFDNGNISQGLTISGESFGFARAIDSPDIFSPKTAYVVAADPNDGDNLRLCQVFQDGTTGWARKINVPCSDATIKVEEENDAIYVANRNGPAGTINLFRFDFAGNLQMER